MVAHSPNLECRMYEAQYLEAGAVVMIEVKSIDDIGVYVSLLEYGDIEGMIPLSELSCRRVCSVGSSIRVGRVKPAVVLTIDHSKGCINLSKRHISEQRILSCEEQYSKSKLVHSIMRRVAETLSVDLEDLYVSIGWPLYQKYGHAFEAFKMILTGPDSVLSSLASKVEEAGSDGQEATKGVPAVTSGATREALIKNIKRRMTPRPSSIGAYIKLTCFRFDGILHIKDSMKEAIAAGIDECPLKVRLVASPLHVLTTQAPDKEQGLAVLNKAIEACAEAIERRKGKPSVKKAPAAVSEQDNGLLARHKAHEVGLNEEEEVSADDKTGVGEGKWGGPWPPRPRMIDHFLTAFDCGSM